MNQDDSEFFCSASDATSIEGNYTTPAPGSEYHRPVAETTSGPTNPGYVEAFPARLVAMTLLAGAVLGCEHRLCVSEGIRSSGDVLTATVVASYVPDGGFTYDPLNARGPGPAKPCSDSDGLAAGGSVQFKTTGTTQTGTMVCEIIAAAVIAAPPAITLNGPAGAGRASDDVQSSDAVIYAAENVTVGGCDGADGFELVNGSGPGGLFGTPMPGAPPPAVLLRVFEPSESTCSLCYDNFVVQVSRPSP